MVTLPGVHDPFFPNSNYIAYTYLEPEGLGVLETVISHEGRHDTLPPDGRRAITFAQSINALRNTMATANNPRRQFSKNEQHQKLMARIAQDWQPSFDATSKHGYSRCGLHINMSLVDATGKSMFAHEDPTKWKHVKDYLQTMFEDGVYLLLSDESSLDRELWRQNHTSTYAQGVKPGKSEHAEDFYFEITRPGANSNPYYATLLTLLGVNEALEKRAPAKDTEAMSNKTSREEYRREFESPHNQVTQALNALEPNLGTRFKDAIAKCPPGHESPPQGWSAHR
jgi:hypothetical protein